MSLLPDMSSNELGDVFVTEEGLPQYFYDSGSRAFFLKNSAGEWVSLSETAFRRELKQRGKREKGFPLSEIDQIIRETEQDKRVDFAGQLAGYRRGLHRIGGKRCLITSELAVIDPKPGEWRTISALIEGLFVGEEPKAGGDGGTVIIDQRAHFYGWLQHAFDLYIRGKIASGLALCIAGEPDCGKSRLAMLLTWIFGGAVSKPYDFFIGRDNFNKDAFESVIQLVDDENADTRLDARLKFAAQIKKVVANDFVKQRGMHRDGVNFSVLWRLLVLVNLEANRLMVLPPLDSDIRDKLLVLKGYRRRKPDYEVTLDTPATQACWPMPMPTRTSVEQEMFRDQLRSELPAFLWWLLNEYKMPSHVAGGRFCVRHWAHPQILHRLGQFSPHVRCWQLIEASGVIFREYCEGTGDTPADWLPRPEWRGTVMDLHKALVGDRSQLTQHERKSVPEPSWLGQRLEACRENFGDEVCSQRREGGTGRRIWILRHKEGLCDEM
jgi:hypothetical protein